MPLFATTTWRHLLIALLLGALCVPSHAAPGLPPVESFFQNSPFSHAVLSPNARFLAVRVGAPGHRDSLAVIDVKTMKMTAVAGFSDSDIGNFEWVNNERLVFDTRDQQVAAGNTVFAPGLFAANRDGSARLQLVDKRGEDWINTNAARPLRTMLPRDTYLLGQRGAQDSESIYVVSVNRDDDGNWMSSDLLHLNTKTGRAKTVDRPGNTSFWLLDQHGEPRVAHTIDRDVEAVYYLEPATSAWRKLTTYRAYTATDAAFTPFAIGADGTLYVKSRGDRDKEAVYTYDLANARISAKPLIATEGYDFRGVFIANKEKLLGMRFVTDAESTLWFDAGMKTVQQAVDALLPATVNLVSVGARPETPWVLVESYSDVLPKTFLLFNTQTRKLSKVGDTYPAIQPSQMGRQQSLRYTARDGLEIPALLTLPPGTRDKNLPLVVLVHGGPFVRGASWGWHAESQFLASRGYAVLEPAFRGTVGFGWKHFHAGWKQWGLAMQDDLADAAKWAIASGMADPKRICIAGASYGGYAALMGTLNDPALFKCGINWAGVTDIGLMYSGHWSFFSDVSHDYKKYGMPQLIGDPVKDAAQFQKTSPLAQAARMRQPLLLAYGGADQRVPLYHGTKFHDAVGKANDQVEWILYPTEGHGWKLPENRFDFWTRVDKFLARHIGKP